MTTDVRKCLALAALVAVTSGAYGQETAEGTRLELSLEAGARFTDNFYYTSDVLGQDEGTGLIVKPAVSLVSATPRFMFTARAAAETGSFDTVSEDNYQDYQFSLGADWKPALRHRFTYSSRLEYDHDPFGTERTEGTARATRELDEWRRFRSQLQYQNGLPADPINLEFSLFGVSKDYQTNQLTTQFLDYQIVGGDTTLFYNYSPKTRLFANLMASHITVDAVAPGAFDRGANELRYLLGTRWAATSRTSGDVRVGYVSRKASDARRDDFSSFDWRAQVIWSPLATRSFSFTGGRDSQESYLANVDFINNIFYSVQWSEDWTQRFRTEMVVGFVDSEFIGTNRRDDVLRLSLDGEYRLSRSLKLLGNVGQYQRDSQPSTFDYDRFSSYLGIRYSN